MASARTPTTTGREGYHRGGEGEKLPRLASRRRNGASRQHGRGSIWSKDTGMGLQLWRVGQLGLKDQVQGMWESRATDHRRQSKGGFQACASGSAGAYSATPSCRRQRLVSGSRTIQEAREGRFAPQNGDYVVVNKKRRRKSLAAQAAALANTLDRERQALIRKLAETERRATDAEKRAKAAADTATTTAAPADVPMSEERWDCISCGADHTRSRKKTCRICAHSRVAASTPADAPTTRSPEEIAAERAVLQQRKEFLSTCGLRPANLAAAIKDIEAHLQRLDELAAVMAEMTPYELLEKARVANDKADAHLEGLVDKAAEIQERIRAMQRDLNAVTCALANAEQEQMRTKAALAAATNALPAAKPYAQATSGAPAAREDGSTQHAHVESMQAFKQSLVTMISEELMQAIGEKDKESLLHRMMAKLAGSGSQPAEPSQLPTAPPHATVTPPQPAPAAPTSEAPAPAVAALVEADIDGSRMPQRVTLKTAAMEQDANASSLRRHMEAAKKTKQERESRIAAGRA